MAVSLGPMPAHLRDFLGQWIEEGRASDPANVEASINARFLVGGPGGCCYLDANGDVWDWHTNEEGLVKAEDGPRKVSIIVYAVERIPALADWLPARPSEAIDCRVCGGTGKAPPPFPELMQCWECVGLGWIL